MPSDNAFCKDRKGKLQRKVGQGGETDRSEGMGPRVYWGISPGDPTRIKTALILSTASIFFFFLSG